MIQTPAGSSQATRAPTLVIRVRGTATCRTVTYSASGSVRGGDATPHRRTPSATRRAIGSALALALIGIASACSAHHAKPNPTAGASPSAKIAAEANRNHVTVDINKGEIVRVTIPPLYQNDGQVTLYNVDPPGSNVVAPVPGAPGYFRGMVPGSVTIRAQQVPPCATQSPSPTSGCDTRPADIGLLTITVKG
ncbi:hypothetical protein Acel_0613 [Acidothermus cellulolyticus 11B]|uniref:Uncharacterized protein n=1 Tax=Acidothermus cellulolyticus (strain ATCC 43068 / DSM 8971 / 11B) TaxID=351607 RepID=A0LSH6_ACIC1|nr:hypothetical protein [Acidothermus cellulolyticus]ABK52386.1 hypothetical protein Acel_0613 [Acidothermus cellulolyticus 11B]